MGNKTPKELEQIEFCLRKFDEILDKINADRVERSGEWVSKKWKLMYLDATEENLSQFTVWDRQYNGLHPGNEYVLCIDAKSAKNHILYARGVYGCSVMWTMHKLFEILGDKF